MSVTVRPFDPARFGGPSRQASSADSPAVPACPHRGEDTGERLPCGPCGGGVKLKVLGCGVHGRCTVGRKAAGVACCATCDERPDRAKVKPRPVRTSAPKAGPAKWIPVPPPRHVPKSTRLVITIAVGVAGAELHAFTGASQRAYAKRVGAEYVVLTDATQGHACFEKFRYRDWVPLFPGGTLAVDADAVVLPDCPDLFDPAHCPADRVGLVDVLPRMHAGFSAHVQKELAAVCASQGVEVPTGANGVYWNSGVWVGRPGHSNYWTPPEKPTPGGWCDEEGWCRRNVFEKGIRTHALDPRFNWTWCEDRQFRQWEQRRPWIAHLAGMGSEVKGWGQSNRTWRAAILRILAAFCEVH